MIDKRAIRIFILTVLIVIMPSFVMGAYAASADESGMPVGGWEPLEVLTLPDDVDVDNASEGRLRSRSILNSASGDVFAKGASDVGYKALESDGQRTFYNRMGNEAEAFMNATKDLTSQTWSGKTVYCVAQIKYSDLGITQDDALKAFVAFDYDHPAYYWISNTVWTNSNALSLVTEEEYSSVSERARINSLVNSGVKEYAALASYGTGTLDKIALVHDRLVDKVDYAYEEDGTTPAKAKWAHSVHGVFDPGHYEVVCEGYAEAFSLIMNYMGIPNYYIIGTAGSGGSGGGGGHAWNAVSDDGGDSYMYMDLTWDDNGKDSGYLYEYFGMPKSDFEQTHFAYTSDGSAWSWLYDIDGSFNDSFADTYYKKGGFYYDGSVTSSAFAAAARTKAARVGSWVSFTSSNWTKAGSMASTLGISWTGISIMSYSGSYYYYGKCKISSSEIDLSSAEVILPEDSYDYTGEAIEPVPTVSLNGVTLIPDENYTVSYTNNIEAGTAAVTIKGKNNFGGTAAAGFTIEKHTHTLVRTEAKAASCAEAGNSAYYTCSGCGKYFADADDETEIEKDSWVIKALGHDYKDSVTAPSCTEKGFTTHSCTRCEHSYVDSYTDALEHDYDEPVWMWVGSEEEGYTAAKATFACTREGCAHAEEATAEVISETTESSCQNKGITVYIATVNFEGAAYTDTKSVDIDVAAHAWGEIKYTWSEDKSACTASRTCKSCGATQTETVASVSEVKKAAKCETDGAKEYTAVFENEEFTTQTTIEKISATGHSWNPGVVTRAATKASEGVRTYTCTECGTTRTESIPKLASDASGSGEEASSGAQAYEIVDLPAVKIKKSKAAKNAVTARWKKVSKKNKKKIRKVQIQVSTTPDFSNDVRIAYAGKSKTSKKIKKLGSKKTYYVRVRSYWSKADGVHVSRWSSVKKVKTK